MDATTSWATELFSTFADQLRLGLQYLPGLLGAAVALLLGWVLARVVRHATTQFAQTFNALLIKYFPTGMLSRARLSPRMATIVGQLLFWTILLMALTVAARIAGLDAVSHWLDRITAHVPNLLVASAIVLAGYVLSLLVREQFEGRFGAGSSAGSLAQSCVLVLALILGLDQLGVDVTLLIAMTVVGASAVSIAIGVSLALAVRVYMTNVIGIRTARTQLHPGQRIRIDDVEGRLLEITPTQLALETEHGKTLVPGRFVDERVTLVITPDPDVSADSA